MSGAVTVDSVPDPCAVNRCIRLVIWVAHTSRLHFRVTAQKEGTQIAGGASVAGEVQVGQTAVRMTQAATDNSDNRSREPYQLH